MLQWQKRRGGASVCLFKHIVKIFPVEIFPKATFISLRADLFLLSFFVFVFVFVFFPIPFVIFAFLFSLPPSRNSDPGSHTYQALFSPLPTSVRVFHFYREKISALSSLGDSGRIGETRLGKLVPGGGVFFM